MQAHFGGIFWILRRPVSKGYRLSVASGVMGEFPFRFHLPLEPISSGHMVLKTDTMAQRHLPIRSVPKTGRKRGTFVELQDDIFFETGVIILPTQRMHYCKGNPSKLPYICIVDSPKMGPI